MRSIVFCTSFIPSASEWSARYKRWLDYHRQLFPEQIKFFIIDDASPYVPSCNQINCIGASDEFKIIESRNTLVRFDSHLGRHSLLSYPGWWRSFLYSVSIARSMNAKKIIHIESDAFILSSRLLKYITDIDEGWTTLWTPSYNMPETAIQVICSDQFHKLEAFAHKDRTEFDGLLAENLLPFTKINKNFIGDRYGEFRVDFVRRRLFKYKKIRKMRIFRHDIFRAKVPKHADFATQVTYDQKIKFMP